MIHYVYTNKIQRITTVAASSQAERAAALIEASQQRRVGNSCWVGGSLTGKTTG